MLSIQSLSPKLFPTILIVLDLCAAAVYGFQGDIRHVVYWVAAGTLTVMVTY